MKESWNNGFHARLQDNKVSCRRNWIPIFCKRGLATNISFTTPYFYLSSLNDSYFSIDKKVFFNPYVLLTMSP